jgi:hypothetical protein
MYHKFSTNESVDELEVNEDTENENRTLRKQNSRDSYEQREALEAYENKVRLFEI